jgi:hypothetical protein
MAARNPRKPALGKRAGFLRGMGGAIAILFSFLNHFYKRYNVRDTYIRNALYEIFT